MPRRTYKRKTFRRKPRINRAKKMVTGHGPTMIERIASGMGSVATLARAVAPVVAAINTEHKYTDVNTTLTAYAPGTNDAIQLLSQISQGTDDNQRIGNSVLLKTLSIKVSFQFTADSVSLLTMYRFIVFAWKGNANSNPPTIAKMFEAPTAFLSAYNKDYTDQFVILKDKIMTEDVGYIPVTTNAAGQAYFKYFKKLDFHARWLNATTGITENHIYVLFRSNNALVGNAAIATLYSRINYTDN